jgi:peptidoglycan/xylan/chitin deacetylase (PgdA/CDA1 family)
MGSGGDYKTMNGTFAKALLIFLAAAGILYPTIYASGNNEPNRVWYRDQVAVLMYHHVADDAISSGTIPTKLFHDQLAGLQMKGYRFLSLDEFRAYMDGANVPDNAVLVTFDDGYEGFYRNVFPILTKLNIPAVNFVITSTLDDPLATGEIPFMTREEIAGMTGESDLIDVQCHTNSFHGQFPDGEARLVGHQLDDGQIESAGEYKARVVSDTQACLNKLGELYPKPINALAYPYGIFSAKAQQYVHEGGIRYAFTITPGMTTRSSPLLQLPRINAGNPAISPEGVHNAIKRQALAVNSRFDEVELAAVMAQLGGSAAVEPDGSAVIRLQGKTWSGKVNSRTVRLAGGEGANPPLRLGKPLLLKNGRMFIGLDDLQRLLGTRLAYDPKSGRYSVSRSPANR